MAVVALETPPVTLESLRKTADVISVESLSLAQTLKALPNRLPGFVADVKNFIGSLTDAQSAPVLGSIDLRQMERVLPKQNYVHLSDVTVFVPPSMNVSWNTYLDALAESQLTVEKLMPETLAPSIRWIAAMLTQPENLASMRSKITEYGIIFHDLDAVKEKISKCYSKTGADTSVRYGDVFDRNADALVAMKRMNDICEALAKINRQEVMNTVNEMTDALDKLLIRMKQNPELYRATGTTMNDISKLTYNLGKEIEFFAAHVYLVQSASQAMQDTKTKLEEVASR